MTFIMLKHILSISTLLRIFYHKWMLNLVKYFFWIYRDDHMFLSFILLMLCVTLTDLQVLNHSCSHGISPTWSWCVILLMYCLICFANNFVEDFFIYIHQRYWPPIFSLFFFLYCLCLVLVSGWCWPHKMSLEMFPLQFFGVVWEGWILNLLWMFSRITCEAVWFWTIVFWGALITLSFLIQSLY